MNEKAERQILQLKQAVERLQEAISLEPTQINKDASIQRFEFTFELTWKLIKSLAFESGIEVSSPKNSLRVGAQLGLLDNIDQWFVFLNARNLSTHVYNEKIADEIYQEIKNFLPAVRQLTERIKEKFSKSEL
ncbi:MAG: HI0074 family nucleotidyltransferase substrate-binding subunit [Patescibacteria group bacterium]